MKNRLGKTRETLYVRGLKILCGLAVYPLRMTMKEENHTFELWSRKILIPTDNIEKIFAVMYAT